MAAYTGRRAPNVSQYIANLNTIPSAHELASSDLSLTGADDLDFLTNAEFFDFDSFNPGPVNVDLHPRRHNNTPLEGGPFQFGDFSGFPTPVTTSPVTGLHNHYPPQPNHQLPYGGPITGDKRKQSAVANIPSPAELEEQSRFAAEEDKRRRNTAASARFRVKKKQREQALEKQAKEMSDKVSNLESKVQQLEMENKWLKGLITDKNDGKTLESLKMEKESEERIASAHTTGVGTDYSFDLEEEDDEFDYEE